MVNFDAVSDTCPLPELWKVALPSVDHTWISRLLFKTGANGKAEVDASKVDRIWYSPPPPFRSCRTLPTPNRYFAHKLCLWMPKRLWTLVLKCQVCSSDLTMAGIYSKTVRKVSACHIISVLLPNVNILLL